MVPSAGFEPATFRLQGDCTTVVLAGLCSFVSGFYSGKRASAVASVTKLLGNREAPTMKPIALLPHKGYNRHLYPKAHILALCGLAYIVTACQQPRPVVVLPPVELATCAEAPTPPKLPAKDGTEATQLVRDRLILEYILAWNTAHGDCAGKVAGLARWRESVGE